MIADVQSGNANFKAILAYDISRWGRFQDADESTYYEYLCKRAGIDVHSTAAPPASSRCPHDLVSRSPPRTTN